MNNNNYVSDVSDISDDEEDVDTSTQQNTIQEEVDEEQNAENEQQTHMTEQQTQLTEQQTQLTEQQTQLTEQQTQLTEQQTQVVDPQSAKMPSSFMLAKKKYEERMAMRGMGKKQEKVATVVPEQNATDGMRRIRIGGNWRWIPINSEPEQPKQEQPETQPVVNVSKNIAFKTALKNAKNLNDAINIKYIKNNSQPKEFEKLANQISANDPKSNFSKQTPISKRGTFVKRTIKSQKSEVV
jgi:hypothetical protein